MKKLFIVIFIAFLMLSGMSWENRTQAAENYPIKPIILMIPLEAGSSGDILARPLAQKASTIIGQPIMIVNKPGGGSSIGYREIYGSKSDGYTIGQATGTIVTNKLQGLLSYDYHDYTIIGVYLNWLPAVVASTKTKRPFNTMEEVLTFAKSHPGEISIASGSVGQLWWVATTAFVEATGLKFNVIPTAASSGDTAIMVAGGHTDLGVTDVAATKSQIDAGNVRVLAVFGSQRIPGKYNNIPTLKEFGYNVIITSTHAVLGPPKMPKDITDKLIKTFKEAAHDPEYLKFLADYHATPFYLPPDQAIKWFDDQRKIMREVMGKAGVLKEK